MSSGETVLKWIGAAPVVAATAINFSDQIAVAQSENNLESFCIFFMWLFQIRHIRLRSLNTTTTNGNSNTASTTYYCHYYYGYYYDDYY